MYSRELSIILVLLSSSPERSVLTVYLRGSTVGSAGISSTVASKVTVLSLNGIVGFTDIIVARQ